VIHVLDVGIRNKEAEGALTDHFGSKPTLEGLLQCPTSLAARKSFLMSHLHNSYCNFDTALLSLFMVAARTGLSASSDPVTFMIKSALKLPYPSLLLPGAK